MTLGEVAKVTRRSERTVSRWVSEGLLAQFQTAGKQTALFRREDVAALFSAKG